jgi:uncharacterized tellurite resistance protein B-like protein
MPLSKLDQTERMRLMRFVCSFAWADLEVHDKERAFIARMMRALRLDAKEKQQVERWLEVPPPPEQVDPASIPRAHRALFLDAIRGVVVADGSISPEERESFALLESLLT